MNKDIRLSVGFVDHPKVMKLERRLSFEGVKALLRLWCFAAQNKPDGHLSGMDPEDIELAAKWTGQHGAFFAAITDERCLWLEARDEGFYLHDWHEHQGWVVHSKDRSANARNAAEARWKKRNAQSMRDALPDDALSNAPSPPPYPEPVPFKRPYSI